MSACECPLVEGYACEGKDTENLGKKKMWRNFCGEKGLGGKRERWMEGGENGKWWIGKDCTGRERSTSMSLYPLSLSSYTNDL